MTVAFSWQSPGGRSPGSGPRLARYELSSVLGAGPPAGRAVDSHSVVHEMGARRARRRNVSQNKGRKRGDGHGKGKKRKGNGEGEGDGVEIGQLDTARVPRTKQHQAYPVPCCTAKACVAAWLTSSARRHERVGSLSMGRSIHNGVRIMSVREPGPGTHVSQSLGRVTIPIALFVSRGT